jgi:hypothetical protein
MDAQLSVEFAGEEDLGLQVEEADDSSLHKVWDAMFEPFKDEVARAHRPVITEEGSTEWDLVRPLVRYGSAILHVYAKSNEGIEVRSLEPLNEAEWPNNSYPGPTFWSSMRLTREYAGHQVEYRGARVLSKIEFLIFDGERSKSLQYEPDSPDAMTVVPLGDFVNASGETIDPPERISSRQFACAEPAIGGLQVEYQCTVQEYCVFYDAGPLGYRMSIITYAVWDPGWEGLHDFPETAIEPHFCYADVQDSKKESQPIPDLPVLVTRTTTAGQEILLVQVGRKGNVKWWADGYNALVSAISKANEKAKKLERKLNETSRTTETTRVTDPNNPDNYVDVEKAKRITLVDGNGKQWIMYLKS